MGANEDLTYRGVRYSVSADMQGARIWTVYRDDLPPVTGSTTRGPSHGAFREAIKAARETIDELLASDSAAAD